MKSTVVIRPATLAALCLIFTLTANARPMEIQELIYARSEQANWAVIQITCLPESDSMIAPVVGTGFLLNDQGYFITAAHVASMDHIGPDSSPIPCTPNAGLRQHNGGGGTSNKFQVIEADTDHDLALCKYDGFSPHDEKWMRANVPKAMADNMPPFASLTISKAPARQGELVLLSGFPLGSGAANLQLGLVAAIESSTPGLYFTKKDSRELLQISVNGNHGNSGGPLIDLDSGQVLGVLLDIMPAPIVINGQLRFDNGNFQSSGIMAAAPASWVTKLLAKHNIESVDIKPGRLYSLPK